jgi:ParB family chromosome partitioning protein
MTALSELAFHDGQLVHLPVEDLKDMSLGGNTRRKVVRANWEDFVASIKAQGVLQSVVARLMPDGSFELLAGYGRRDAAIEAGLKEIPALIRIVDDVTALQINLAENLNRSELSFGDQLLWATRFISLYKGDVESAAQRLSWGVNKLRERLSLAPCTSEVLDALDDGHITVKHALILAAFESKIQNNTLAKVIAEKWSVSDLKARADRVQIPLSKAIFDKSVCSQCQHNTELQAGLFGMPDSALCSKSSCFQVKTKEALEVKKLEAEEKFGTVIWLSQSLPEDRQTVTATVVGTQQFETGCTACENRVAVINDTLNGQIGAVLESQCTDKRCFADCANAYDAFVKAQQSKTVIDDNVADEEVAEEEACEAGQDHKVVNMKKAPVKVGAISQPLEEAHWAEIRAASGQYIDKSINGKFALVMQLVGLMKISEFKPIRDLTNSMPALMAKSEKELQQMMEKVIQHIALEAKNICGFDANKVIAASGASTEGGEAEIIRAWQPTEDILKKYTTSAIVQIVKSSGFATYLESKEEGSSKKLLSAKKGDLVAGILAVTDFDWSHYAPPAYVDMVNSVKEKQQQAA